MPEHAKSIFKKFIFFVICIPVLAIAVFTLMDTAPKTNLFPNVVGVDCNACGANVFRSDDGTLDAFFQKNNFNTVVINCDYCGVQMFSVPGWTDRFSATALGWLDRFGTTVLSIFGW